MNLKILQRHGSENTISQREVFYKPREVLLDQAIIPNELDIDATAMTPPSRVKLLVSSCRPLCNAVTLE